MLNAFITASKRKLAYCVDRHLKARNLTHLAVRTGSSLTTDTLLRCARGEMITCDAVNDLTAHLYNARAFRTSAASVRGLSLAIEL